MHGERMWHTFRLFTILSAVKRTQYYKDKKIFHSMGENCLIMDRIVHFNTHDITHVMLNNRESSLPRGGVSIMKKQAALRLEITFLSGRVRVSITM